MYNLASLYLNPLKLFFFLEMQDILRQLTRSKIFSASEIQNLKHDWSILANQSPG